MGAHVCGFCAIRFAAVVLLKSGITGNPSFYSLSSEKVKGVMLIDGITCKSGLLCVLAHGYAGLCICLKIDLCPDGLNYSLIYAMHGVNIACNDVGSSLSSLKLSDVFRLLRGDYS